MEGNGECTALVVVVMGIPASGKTKTCKALAEIMQRENRNGTSRLKMLPKILSFDSVEQQLLSSVPLDYEVNHSDNSEGNCKDNVNSDNTHDERASSTIEVWHAAREEAYTSIHRLLLTHKSGQTLSDEPNSSDDHPESQIHSSTSDTMANKLNHFNTQKDYRLLVIVDDTMVYGSMRKRIFNYAVEAGAAYLCVHINIDSRIAVARDKARSLQIGGENHNVGEATILREEQRLEPPGKSDSFEEEWRMVCDGTDDVAINARRIWNEIRNTVWKPAIRRGISDEEGRLQRAIGSAGNSKSLVHQLDLRTRRYLSEEIKRTSKLDPEVRKSRAKQLSTLRRSLLDRAKQALCWEDCEELEQIFIDTCSSHDGGNAC